MKILKKKYPNNLHQDISQQKTLSSELATKCNEMTRNTGVIGDDGIDLAARVSPPVIYPVHRSHPGQQLTTRN